MREEVRVYFPNTKAISFFLPAWAKSTSDFWAILVLILLSENFLAASSTRKPETQIRYMLLSVLCVLLIDRQTLKISSCFRIRNRGVRGWLLLFPFPSIPVKSLLFPSHSHSQSNTSFPFPFFLDISTFIPSHCYSQFSIDSNNYI